MKWLVALIALLLLAPALAQESGDEPARPEESGNDKPADHNNKTRDPPKENRTDEAPDRNAFQRCNELEGDERTRCITAYCESPSERHVDDCRKWNARQQAQQEKSERKQEFSTCRQASDAASDRKECAQDHRDSVREDHAAAKQERQLHIDEAKASQRIGAELKVRPGAEFAPDIQSYDVDVHLETLDARAGQDPADFRVTVSAELAEGRTIVMDIDPEILSGPQLVVRYFDVHDDGTETEVLIRNADDLLDALDPDNDGGQPEYWIVSDADGLHMMASIPHWSTHALTVQGIGEFVESSPSLIAGVVVGVVGSIMAVAVMFWPRREES